MNAIRDYTSSSYEDINAYLRGDNNKSDKQQQIDDINYALSKYELPSNMLVYRYSNGKDFFDGSQPTLQEIKDKYVGEDVHAPAFTSTTIDKDGAQFFQSEKYAYKIEIPKGVGRGAYIKNLSLYKSEKEFLIKSDSYFKIVDAYEKDNKIYIRMRMKA